jgi:uncharacterized membrane protein YtjA (UPF0391 family)
MDITQRMPTPCASFKEGEMYYALMFLVLGMIAGVLHIAGVAAVTAPMSWVLLVTGIMLLAIYVFTERTARVT